MAYVRTRRIIDDSGADAVIAAAEAKAREQGSRVAIAVVDPHGELIQMRRTPETQIASSRVALDKARTAAIFVRPSREMEEQVTNGRLGALALHGASCLTGGIPLKVGDEVVGAIGTSGETPDEDESCSIAGAMSEFSTAEVPVLTQAGWRASRSRRTRPAPRPSIAARARNSRTRRPPGDPRRSTSPAPFPSRAGSRSSIGARWSARSASAAPPPPTRTTS